MGVGGQRHASATLPPGKTRYPLYRRLGGHQGRSGGVRKISPTPGFDPRTVQPLASSSVLNFMLLACRLNFVDVHIKQDENVKYNVTLRHVRGTIAVV